MKLTKDEFKKNKVKHNNNERQQNLPRKREKKKCLAKVIKVIV